MNMDQALVVGALISELKEVNGRKRLQKIVHLLKEKGYAEFRQRFKLHYFGPFSREVAEQLDFLRDAELVDETLSGDTYTYRPMDDPEAAELLSGSDVAGSKPDWVAFAQELDKHTVVFLEALSTIVFLNSQRQLRAEALRKSFDKLKPALGGEFDRAHSFAVDKQLIEAN